MKDPAILVYFDKWISSTNGMKASFRAWLFDLLVCQYDRGFVPGDEDELAGICRVLPSEYDLFKHMLQQVFTQKFKLVEGKYYNDELTDIIRKREAFVEKRSNAGNIGVIIKAAKTLEGITDAALNWLKEQLIEMSEEEIEKHKNKQVLQHLLTLFINVDKDKDVIKKEDKDFKPQKAKIIKAVIELEFPFDSIEFLKVWNVLILEPKWKKKTQNAFQLCLDKLGKYPEQDAIEMIKNAISGNWSDVYELKEKNTTYVKLNHNRQGTISTDIKNAAITLLGGNKNNGY